MVGRLTDILAVTSLAAADLSVHVDVYTHAVNLIVDTVVTGCQLWREIRAFSCQSSAQQGRIDGQNTFTFSIDCSAMEQDVAGLFVRVSDHCASFQNHYDAADAFQVWTGPYMSLQPGDRANFTCSLPWQLASLDFTGPLTLMTSMSCQSVSEQLISGRVDVGSLRFRAESTGDEALCRKAVTQDLEWKIEVQSISGNRHLIRWLNAASTNVTLLHGGAWSEHKDFGFVSDVYVRQPHAKVVHAYCKTTAAAELKDWVQVKRVGTLAADGQIEITVHASLLPKETREIFVSLQFSKQNGVHETTLRLPVEDAGSLLSIPFSSTVGFWLLASILGPIIAAAVCCCCFGPKSHDTQEDSMVELQDMS
mmetsp:Transcript_42056/g.78129  ORF Transcript_42056/g.78129 Transcript_42056/m.78129 type:complete len:365 (+) Transcript_42056:65-1159(+)